ncbi:MAG: murein biosynthesis integral membrane protein MurJ [Pseudomonadota bacterium]
MRPIRLISGFLTVGAWTFLSRILGFARDLIIAASLGSGPVAQAFLMAFALPNMFRRFFAEGAFNTAFVPLFSKKLEAEEGAAEFARDAFSALASVLIVVTLIAQLAMPLLVYAIASGFAGDARFDLTVLYGRIVFGYILLISLAALLSGVLNATGRFLAAAAAPALLNVVLIAALVMSGGDDEITGLWLSWGALLGGVAQLGVVWWAAARAGFRVIPRIPVLTPDLKRLAVIAFPAALAGGVMQVNLLVGRQVASFFDGAVVWLNLADRLYQLPLGVVGIAIGVVLLPDLSRRLTAGDTEGSRNAANRAAEFALVLSLPATIALMVIAQPLAHVLFERGAFTAADTAATALAIAVYGAGLPAFVLLKVVQPLFFAREDTKTPFRMALWAMAVNAVVAVAGAPLVGFIAAALGTTLAAWVNLALLWARARSLGPAVQPDSRLIRSAPRVVLSSLIMGSVLVLMAMVLIEPLHTPRLRYVALALLVAVGMVVYGASVVLTRALTPADLRAMVKRG